MMKRFIRVQVSCNTMLLLVRYFSNSIPFPWTKCQNFMATDHTGLIWSFFPHWVFSPNGFWYFCKSLGCPKPTDIFLLLRMGDTIWATQVVTRTRGNVPPETVLIEAHFIGYLFY